MNALTTRNRKNRIATAHRLGAALATLLLSLALGCAHVPREEPQEMGRIRLTTPGSLFPTAEEALIHALAYGHSLSRGVPATERRLRGGTIRELDGGFTFDPPIAARSDARFELDYGLSADTVAHYRIHPKMGLSDPRRAKQLKQMNAHDRTVVDRHDPMHRPFYLLTPNLEVKEYRGPGDGVRAVARLGIDPSAPESRFVVWTDEGPFAQIAILASNEREGNAPTPARCPGCDEQRFDGL